MTTRLTILVAAALLLTACQTMTPEERRIADGNTCASYGFAAVPTPLPPACNASNSTDALRRAPSATKTT